MNDSGASTNTNAFDFSAVKTGIESVLGVFTANLTVANIASVLGIVVVACLTLYLFYWGARKGIAMLQSAFSGHGFHVQQLTSLKVFIKMNTYFFRKEIFMKIVILLLGLCILLLLYLIWTLYKYVVVLLYYNSLSAEDAEYMYRRAVGKDDD